MGVPQNDSGGYEFLTEAIHFSSGSTRESSASSRCVHVQEAWPLWLHGRISDLVETDAESDMNGSFRRSVLRDRGAAARHSYQT